MASYDKNDEEIENLWCAKQSLVDLMVGRGRGKWIREDYVVPKEDSRQFKILKQRFVKITLELEKKKLNKEERKTKCPRTI
tara:strand:+ start:239 stop:481 length:243 start_codon:yes stop_codon:yes gene_type:complete